MDSAAPDFALGRLTDGARVRSTAVGPGAIENTVTAGLVAPTGSLYYALGLFLLIDIALTAFLGLSPGRFAARIRVVRDVDGGPPGLWAALLRTVIVVLTGWIGLFVYLLQRRYVDGSAPRMWWDAAARTRLTSSAAAAG